jgi:transposase|tara:strand:+ start:10008 stop:10517 length:510 start_codon:yes stop_codon:yes gene_type:complete
VTGPKHRTEDNHGTVYRSRCIFERHFHIGPRGRQTDLAWPDPKAITQTIRTHAPNAQRVVFETGPLSVWFYHALTAERVPAICIDARHAKAALDMAPNKTDVNDADGLAHLAEVGFYREVRVKSFDAMLVRTLVAARRQMLKMTVQISNQIRGLMKTFGLVVPKVRGAY